MRDTILHALSVAADRFAENAKTMRAKAAMWGQIDGTSAHMIELADRFDVQAKETYAAHALLSEGFLCAFSTDNAAFQGGGAPLEAKRLLNGIARGLELGAIGGKAIDYNGNAVGFWSLEHTDEADADEDQPQAEEA